jgi:RsiW-degrading membrane proteinase PrsW (M82 family)
VASFWILPWAVIPPLLLLLFYYRRTPAAPPPLHLLLLFIIGAISGFLALGLEWLVETVAGSVMNRSFFGLALRQLLVIAPIEEGCKLVAVVLANWYLQRRYRLRATTVFLFTIAAALGFTAEENSIYLWHGTSSILERSIGTPVHAMFSAPWGYALAKYFGLRRQFQRHGQLIAVAWINAVICHALVNILSSAWGYPLPLHLLSYILFPFLLWMFWRLEQLLRRVQGKLPIVLISDSTLRGLYWQRSLILFTLILGGNAIFGLFMLARKLSHLRPVQVLQIDVLLFTLGQILLNLVFGILAWLIYRYLRHLALRHIVR